MLIIDTHTHASPYWMEPVELLLHQMDANEVDKALLVQFMGAFDNSYIIECLSRYPGRFSVVALVDTASADAPDRLEEWVNEGAEGVRLTPPTRSPGDDPLAIWKKAEELDVPVSLIGTLEDFASPQFENIVRDMPGLKLVLEHLGGVGAYFGPGRADKEIPYDTYRKVLGLARYPNAYMKIPGFGEFCPRPIPLVQPNPFPETPSLIEMALEAFGANRLMWGSDFPPSAYREGYRNALRLPMENVQFVSEEDKEWVFGKTATALWKFGR